jgi:hypothetical protein
MRAKTIGIIAGALIVAAIAMSAVALSPLGLLSRPNPDTSDGSTGGTAPHPLAFEKPAWNAGDSWTYTAAASRDGGPGGAIATGTLTRRVESVDASVVNVSVAAAFRAHWTLAPDTTGTGGSIMIAYRMYFTDANISGYTWYRASDLATLKEVRTVHFEGNFETDSGVYHAAYTATVETTYEPALDMWSFPLQANEAWNATATGTVHVTAQWAIDAPNQPWVFQKDMTITRDVHLFLVSGPSEDIVTPAGTFQAIPVWLAQPHIEIIGPSPGPRLVDGLDEDLPMPGDHVAGAWFSGTAKNVVKVAFDTAGTHLDLALTEYHLG